MAVEGDRRVGGYELLGELGRGGMGVVYLARQVGLNRTVALKALLTLGGMEPLLAERFLREARMAGALAHPNIVMVHDFFEELGVPYIAMEHVPGGSLRPHVHALSLAQAAGVFEGVLAGLAHAERHAIVHRDLKPENLMVTAEGRIKIADFGIAKAVNQTGLGASLTATGATLGTPLYMAPEQARALELGPPADLYSLGVIAYEMLAGAPPFPATDPPLAMLLHHIKDPVPDPRLRRPELDPELAAWTLRLLEKAPEDRPPSAATAWEELEPTVVRLLGPLWRRQAPLHIAIDGQRLPTPRPLTPPPFTAEPPDTTPTTAQTPPPLDAPQPPPITASAPGPSVEPAPGPSDAASEAYVTFEPAEPSRPPVVSGPLPTLPPHIGPGENAPAPDTSGHEPARPDRQPADSMAATGGSAEQLVDPQVADADPLTTGEAARDAPPVATPQPQTQTGGPEEQHASEHPPSEPSREAAIAPARRADTAEDVAAAQADLDVTLPPRIHHIPEPEPAANRTAPTADAKPSQRLTPADKWLIAGVGFLALAAIISSVVADVVAVVADVPFVSLAVFLVSFASIGLVVVRLVRRRRGAAPSIPDPRRAPRARRRA